MYSFYFFWFTTYQETIEDQDLSVVTIVFHKPYSRFTSGNSEVNASFGFKLSSVSESLRRALIGSVQVYFVSIRVHFANKAGS